MKTVYWQVKVYVFVHSVLGDIIGIETVQRRLSPNVRACRTFWTESPAAGRQYGFYIRIFYILGQQANVEIGEQ